jgi:hypothetical protein
MKYFFLCWLCLFSISASAQFWHIEIKWHKRYPLLARVQDHSVAKIKISTLVGTPPVLEPVVLNMSDYRLELAEASVMKKAQRNMRDGVYNVASYNFSDLAALYIQQNRLSEAKWYYLQSNYISRQENDDQHTIANLIGLAKIKLMLGDFDSCNQDLTEARNIARAHGLVNTQVDIEKQMQYIKDNKATFTKTIVHYADDKTALR